MDTYLPAMAASFRSLLEARGRALTEMLRHEAEGAGSGHEVLDFKDLASGETLAVVNGVQAGHAASELEQVGEALRRIADHSYGRCLDCGDRIDLRRLLAMPAAKLCTSCQAVHEHDAAAR